MPSYKNLADVFQGGATTSQHVEARDDTHFKDTTFALKRTRSLGLLDDYIIPSEAKLKDDFVSDETVNKINKNHNNLAGSSTSISSLINQNGNTEDANPQAPTRKPELKHRLPKLNTDVQKQPEIEQQRPSLQSQQKQSILYNSDSSDDEEESDIYLPQHQGTIRQSESPAPHQPRPQRHHHHQAHKADHEYERATSASPTITSPEFLPHDDNDLVYEPQRHVDYLSHDWKESDISKSWRYIVLKRKDVANSARLENASWRTWAQAKNHLKTVSPESVNWLKESDVTWLYGPLYKEPKSSGDFVLDGQNQKQAQEEFHKQQQQAQSTDANQLQLSDVRDSSGSPDNKENKDSHPHGPKPILKKRTAAEMMLSQAEFMKLSLMQSHHRQWNPHTGSPILEAIQHSSSPNSNLNPAKSASANDRTLSPISLTSPLMKPSIEQSTDSVNTSSLLSSSSVPQSSAGSKKDRHIHFNETVEQCIALDIPSENEEEHSNRFNLGRGGGYESEESSDSDESSDDEGGFCLKVKSPSSAFLYEQGVPGFEQQKPQRPQTSKAMSRSSSSGTTTGGYPQTIALLPSTNLNYHSTDDEDDHNLTDQEGESEEEKEYVSVPFYDNRVSHNVHTNRNYDYHYNYDYNSIYPSSTASTVINDKKNDDLQVFDIPENLDLGSILQIEDVAQESEEQVPVKPTLSRSSSGYSLNSQHSAPLPPYQSNDLASGSSFSLHNDDSSDEDDANQRLQKINNTNTNSNDNITTNQSNNNTNNNGPILSSKTKDLANAFLGNWKK